MPLSLLIFLLGIAILLFSTQRFVKLAQNISSWLRLSPLIVGITVVAIGTSLPELAVSLVSILRHDAGLAIGNIVGSNIINILMVLPIGLFVGRLRIGTTKTQRNALFLLIATILFLVLQSPLIDKLIAGLILIFLALGVTILEYYLGVQGRYHEDRKQLKFNKSGKIGTSILISIPLLILGIVAGSLMVVTAVETISKLTGISSNVLGLTITAIATSLPELLTTIFSQEENQEKITVGNILGSNIYNLLLIGGIITLFQQSSLTGTRELVWLITTTLCFVALIVLHKGNKPPKVIGVGLLFLFFIYLFSQQAN